MIEYKVTNLSKDARKFRDSRLGKDILVEPQKTVITERPPEKSDIWKVEIHTEKIEENKMKGGNKQENENKKTSKA